MTPSSRKSSCEMRNSGAGWVNSSEGEVAMDTVPSATTRPVANPTRHGTTIGEDRRTFFGKGPRRVDFGRGVVCAREHDEGRGYDAGVVYGPRHQQKPQIQQVEKQ